MTVIITNEKESRMALGAAGWVCRKVCLSCFFRRDNNLQPYFFFAPFLAAAFFGAGLDALDLTAAFLAIMFVLSCCLSMCGMIGFSAASGIMCRADCIVNDRNKIIFASRRGGTHRFD
ncbi:MAG TPA: hypothetical protein VIK62_02450 [Verrucomicrobiae bacterium]